MIKQKCLTLKVEIVLVLVLALVFILRIPSLFEPFWYGDEGIFAAVGHGLNKGQMLYLETWDNKPPMIYIYYSLIFRIFGESMFWLRLITAIWVTLTSLVVFDIARRLWSDRRGILAVLIFGILSSLPVIEGNLALTEILMLLPTSIAFWLILLKNKGLFNNFDDVFVYLTAGAFLCFAFLFKQMAVFDAITAGIIILTMQDKPIKRAISLTVGFLSVFAVFSLYFLLRGTLSEFIFAAYTYYFIYLSEGPGLPKYFIVFKILPAVLASGFLFYKFFRHKKITLTSAILMWVCFALLGSIFSGRPYGHYLIQMVLPISLLAVSFVRWQKIKVFDLGISILIFVSGLYVLNKAFGLNNFQGDVLRSNYYRNFVAFASGEKNYREYSDSFDRNAYKLKSVSEYLTAKGSADQYIYIWGDYSWAYVLADAKESSRYITSFHVRGLPNGADEVIKSLTKNQPKFIVKTPNAIGGFDELDEFIETHNYRLINVIEGSEIFAI